MNASQAFHLARHAMLTRNSTKVLNLNGKSKEVDTTPKGCTIFRWNIRGTGGEMKVPEKVVVVEKFPGSMTGLVTVRGETRELTVKGFSPDSGPVEAAVEQDA